MNNFYSITDRKICGKNLQADGRRAVVNVPAFAKYVTGQVLGVS